MLGHIARTYDKGYGHFTTRQNIQFNWPALSDVPAILADLADVEMHCHPDLGQLHPQCHRRPFRRRCRRRGRRSAPLCRNPAAVVVGASGILLPAAQVQDRGDGRRARPRRHPDPRYRPASEEERRPARLGFAVYVGGGQGRTPMIAKKIRDFLPEADLLVLLRRRSCASTISTAAATTSTRRASRSSCTRPASRNSPARSRPSGRQLKDAELKLPEADIRAHRRLFRAAGVEPRRPRRRRGGQAGAGSIRRAFANGSTRTSSRTAIPTMRR